MNISTNSALGLLFSATALSGCAQQAPAAANPAQAAAAAPLHWDDMDRDQRMTHMGEVVFPKMKEVFSSNAEFRCQNCHGDDMSKVDFKMPNDLYPLPAAGTIEAARDYDAEVTEFMANQVLPTMAKLLDKPVGAGGVSCLTCHPTEE